MRSCLRIPPLLLVLVFSAATASPQSGQQTAVQPVAQPTIEKPKPRIRPNDAGPSLPTRFDMLRGAYGPYRANNDLLYYHLDIRVDPEQKSISGKNTIRFRMLKDGTRIQLDLNEALNI